MKVMSLSLFRRRAAKVIDAAFSDGPLCVTYRGNGFLRVRRYNQDTDGQIERTVWTKATRLSASGWRSRLVKCAVLTLVIDRSPSLVVELWNKEVGHDYGCWPGATSGNVRLLHDERGWCVEGEVYPYTTEGERDALTHAREVCGCEGMIVKAVLPVWAGQ